MCIYTVCVTFITASVCSSNHPTSACPDSWKATTLCSSLHRILLFFTLPEVTYTNSFSVRRYQVYCCPLAHWRHHCTCYNSLHCIFKVKGIDGLVSLSGRVQSSFVTNVSDVRACRDKVRQQQRFSRSPYGTDNSGNIHSIVLWHAKMFPICPARLYVYSWTHALLFVCDHHRRS